MRLEGSCHCGAVRFSVEAASPVPFMRCYCSICRKTGGGGGYAINLGADAATLKVEGAGDIRTYNAVMRANGAEERSSAQRKFCGRCGTALWLFDPGSPGLVHPLASAIDTELPVPPEHVHIMLASKAGWVEPCVRAGDREFAVYPDESLADWHARMGMAT